MAITTDERMSQWLCESIEDTIKRYQEVLKSDTEWVANDEKSLADAQKREYFGVAFYEKSVAHGKARLVEEREAIDQLLILLKCARELEGKIKAFWEIQAKRFVEVSGPDSV